MLNRDKKANNSNDMAAVYTAIYNNHYSMVELFRNQELRESRFKLSLVKSHKSFGNDIFKVRHHQYFDQFKKNRYKTRHLLLREVHRALRGTITKQQKEKEKQALMMKVNPGGIEQVDMISAYPDKTLPSNAQDMIQTLNKMVNEDDSNNIGHFTKDKLLKMMDHSGSQELEMCTDDPTKMNQGDELIQKVGSYLDQKVQEELDEVSKYEQHSKTVFNLMDGDVKSLFTPQQFKKVMDSHNSNNFLLEVSLRLASRFYDSVTKRIVPPIPNLGKQSMVTKRGKDCDKMVEMLQFALQQLDRDLFTKLRDGVLSLHQIMARIQQQKTGRVTVVLDDLRDDLHPSCLVKPSRYVEAAYADQQLEANLLRNAKKRGVDPKVLADTAKSISYNSKCVRSVYSKPQKKRLSPNQALNFVQHKVTSDLTIKNHKQIESDYVKNLSRDQKAKWEAFEIRKQQLSEQLKEHKSPRKVNSFAAQLNLPSELKQMVLQNEKHKTQQTRNFKAQTDLKETSKSCSGKTVGILRPQSSNPYQKAVQKSSKLLFDDEMDEIPELLKEKLQDIEGLRFLVRLADDYSDAVKHPNTKVHLPKKFFYKATNDTSQTTTEHLDSYKHEDTSQAYKNFVEETSNGVPPITSPANLPVIDVSEELNEEEEFSSPGKRHYIVLNKTPQTNQTNQHQQQLNHDEQELATMLKPQRNLMVEQSTTSDQYKLVAGDVNYTGTKTQNSRNQAKEGLVVPGQGNGSQRYSRPKSSVQLGGGAKAYPRHKAQQLRKNVLESTQQQNFKATRTSSNISLLHNEISNKQLQRPQSNIAMRNSSAFSINGLSVQRAPQPTDFENTTTATHTQKLIVNKGHNIQMQHLQHPNTTTHNNMMAEVPDGVIDWYLNNITKTIEIRPNSQNTKNKKTYSKNSGFYQSAFQSAGGNQKRIIGLHEDRSELSLGTIPVEETSLQTHTHTQNKKQDQSFLNDFTGATHSKNSTQNGQGFNWLTGTKMNVYAHEKLTYNINKKQSNLTEPVLQKMQHRGQGTSHTGMVQQRCSSVLSPTSQMSAKSIPS